MMNKWNWETGIKIAKLLLVVAAVYLGMKFILPIVLPFLIALVLARMLFPLARAMQKKLGISKTMSRFAAYGVFLAAMGSVAALLLYLFYRMGSAGLSNLRTFLESANQMLGRCCEGLEQMTGFGTDEIQQTITEGVSGFTGGAVEYSKDAGWYMVGLLAKIFITLIAAFLMLSDYERITRGIQKTAFGRGMVHMLREIKSASGAYLKAQLIIMGIVTAICIAGLFLLGTKNAFWVGIAIGVCDAMPFLGTGTVFVPWAIFALLLGHYLNAAGYLAIYIVSSFTREMLEPRLVGKRLGVPPLAVLMSIYIGLQVYGGAGVVLGPVSALVLYELFKEE